MPCFCNLRSRHSVTPTTATSQDNPQPKQSPQISTDDAHLKATIPNHDQIPVISFHSLTQSQTDSEQEDAHIFINRPRSKHSSRRAFLKLPSLSSIRKHVAFFPTPFSSTPLTGLPVPIPIHMENATTSNTLQLVRPRAVRAVHDAPPSAPSKPCADISPALETPGDNKNKLSTIFQQASPQFETIKTMETIESTAKIHEFNSGQTDDSSKSHFNFFETNSESAHLSSVLTDTEGGSLHINAQSPRSVNHFVPSIHHNSSSKCLHHAESIANTIAEPNDQPHLSSFTPGTPGTSGTLPSTSRVASPHKHPIPPTLHLDLPPQEHHDSEMRPFDHCEDAPYRNPPCNPATNVYMSDYTLKWQRHSIPTCSKQTNGTTLFPYRWLTDFFEPNLCENDIATAIRPGADDLVILANIRPVHWMKHGFHSARASVSAPGAPPRGIPVCQSADMVSVPSACVPVRATCARELASDGLQHACECLPIVPHTPMSPVSPEAGRYARADQTSPGDRPLMGLNQKYGDSLDCRISQVEDAQQRFRNSTYQGMAKVTCAGEPSSIFKPLRHDGLVSQQRSHSNDVFSNISLGSVKSDWRRQRSSV